MPAAQPATMLGALSIDPSTDYGVVIDRRAWAIDEAATRERRAAIRTARGWTRVPKVQWHDPLPRSPAAE